MRDIDRYQERIKELEETIESYLVGKHQIGVVSANSFMGQARVKVNQEDAIFPLQNRNMNLKIGDKVLIVKEVIVKKLPKELEVIQHKPSYVKTYWEEIGGLKSQVKRIRESVEFATKYEAYYKDFNLSQPKGLLLYGAPGCGKTMIAKAITTSMNGNSFVYIKGGEVLSPYVGVAEQNIKNIFENARKTYKETNEKVVIFIDEAEAILPRRGSRKSSDVDTTIVPTFLSEMDGFEEGATFVILATNYPDQLDPAVVRPGRIDVKVEITRPTLDDAADIFNVYFNKYKIIKNPLNLSIASAELLFASKCVHQISGALISRIVQDAAVGAIKRYEKTKENYTILLEDIKQVLNAYNC